MRRPIIAARVLGRVVTLSPVRDCTIGDVVDVVERAAIVGHRRVRGGVIVGLSQLADVEAFAELSRWYVVVRAGSKAGRP